MSDNSTYASNNTNRTGRARPTPRHGGAAGRLAEHSIKKVEVLEYEELGMEAIWRIEVEDFPAFIIIDNKGNDFYSTFESSGQRRVQLGS